jgi:hypothetical protein
MQQNLNKAGSRRRRSNGKQRGEDSQHSRNAAAAEEPMQRKHGYSSPKALNSHYGSKGGGILLPNRRASENETASNADEDEKIALHMELEYLISSSMKEDPVTEDTKRAIFAKCKGNVMKLAYHSHGCRLLQSSFDVLEDDGMLKELTDELQGRVLEASINMHGNHVLQKAINLLRPSDADSMLQELTKGPASFKDGWFQPWSATQIARSKYGCRVLERVIEHFLPNHDTCIEFLQPIIEDCQALCTDQYGNFIIQHLLEHGTQSHKNAIMRVVKKSLEEFAVHQHACSVLDKALSYTELQDELADQILKTQITKGQYLIVEMASKIRIGYTAVERMLVMMTGEAENGERTERLKMAKDQLSVIRESLKDTRQGKELLRKLWPEDADSLVDEQVVRAGRDRKKEPEQRNPSRS